MHETSEFDSQPRERPKKKCGSLGVDRGPAKAYPKTCPAVQQDMHSALLLVALLSPLPLP